MTSRSAATQMDALLAQWNDWLAGRTDAMLSLEDRVRTAGSDRDRADLAAAFVARKAIGERLQAIADLARRDRDAAATLAGRPLTDSLGGPVGTDLADAAALVDAIVGRVEAGVSTIENQAAGEVTLATQAGADLAVAERLAGELGSHVNQAAQLRGDLVARRDLASVARRAAELRGQLERTDAERGRLLKRWASLDSRLGDLAAAEASVRQLADRCRDKVVQAPTLAVPSVEAVGELLSIDVLKAMPWAAARTVMAPVLDKIERLEAAFAEARRRYQQPLDDRDDLRGLLEGFRDKAGDHGFGEDGALEPLYRQAESLLWTAPCDLTAARPLVDRYVAAVNAIVASAASSDEVES